MSIQPGHQDAMGSPPQRSIEQAEDALKRSEERFRKIFEYSNDTIFIIEPERDRILDANPRACALLGYGRDELLSMPASAIHPHEVPKLLEFTRSVLKHETGWTDELSCMTKSGGTVPSEISASLIDIDGETCVVAMVRDITERKRAQEALKEANEELEKHVAERTSELLQANTSLQEALAEVERLKNRLHAENVYLQEEIKVAHNFEDIISRSRVIKQVLREVEQVASTDATVLVLGETGTGKELLARAIHSISRRRDRPLVKVNCAALPANLIESELFGHEKGAFTGAVARKTGRFELADGGTIFLDEIGDLPMELQAKLLRVLQEGEFERLGNARTIKVDVRIIAATNRDLEEATKNGMFREDLYYRLNVFPVKSPPLRERREDIPLLVQHFMQKFSLKMGKRIDSVSQATVDDLKRYDWPGNVRELENLIERAVILSKGSNLELEGRLSWQNTRQDPASGGTLEERERHYILEVLERTGWRVSGDNGAARILGMKPTTLESRMKKLGVRRTHR